MVPFVDPPPPPPDEFLKNALNEPMAWAYILGGGGAERRNLEETVADIYELISSQFS
jgi:hypothetical protein